MQLRYWRPGQQDRFFVCYGFGLYDTRQSAVSFGKSRMYYIDELNARLQYLSSPNSPLRIHASMGYVFNHMETEESDIYNLYESRSHLLSPQLRMIYDAQNDWRFEWGAMADIELRKGYENIIEEYLIDKDNNIYDFRTIDTRQNYIRNICRLVGVLKAVKRVGRMDLNLQGGVTTESYEEKYKANNYRIKVQTIIPHVKVGMNWHGHRDDIAFSLLYARQRIGRNDYEVSLQDQKIPHLDFQHAFAPYAFRCAELDKITTNVTWQHQMSKMAVGVDAKLYLTDGNRKDDVAFSGSVGFRSTAPMITVAPDKHKEIWAELTAFVLF